MAKFKLEGISELKKALSPGKKINKVRNLVRKKGAKLLKESQYQAQSGVAFKKGYSLGATKKSMRLEMSNDNMEATVGVGTEYAPYVEYGTRKMEAEPFLKPAFMEVSKEFKEELDDIMKGDN